MKKLFLIGMAAAMLTACSSDDTVDQPKATKQMSFSSFVENTTRSIDPSLAVGKFDIALWGFVSNDDGPAAKIFDAQSLDTDGSYSPLQYWSANNTYAFGALAPRTGANWKVTETSYNSTSKKVEMKLSFENKDGKQDLLYAAAGRTQTATIDNSEVGLNFKHMLSKVKFTFKNVWPASGDVKYTMTVKDIKITNAPASGNLAITNDAYTWSGQTGTLTLQFGNGVDAAEAAEAAEAVVFDQNASVVSNNELLTIPYNPESGYTVTFTAEVFQNGVSMGTKDFTATVKADLKQGYCYNFIAKLSNESFEMTSPILFSVETVENWTDGGDKPFAL